MRNTSRHGNTAEVRSAGLLAEQGYIVGSRRHIGGAGDLLAIPKPGEVLPALLAEVKRGKRPFENFRRGDREALIETATEFQLVPILLYWAPGYEFHRELFAHDWPGGT